MKQSSTRTRTIVVLYVQVLLFFNAVHRISSVSSPGSLNRCAASNLYMCPNCGGIEVSDCLQCDGYLNTDQNHGICFDRKLFSRHEELDPDYHYPHLWNDIVGAFIWFVVAGVATACGVGGGGIYVPLGIILLRFASKPASGLSQASIFGASLGGFIINVRSHHPNKKIRDTAQERGRGREHDATVAVVEEEESSGKDEHEQHVGTITTRAETQMEMETETGKVNHDDNDSLSPSSLEKCYTRPLIDYDMALFLAPMEMAGAVMGVIIQKLMPNWLFLSLAAIILGLTSIKTFQKFLSSYRIDKENRNNRETLGRSPLAHVNSGSGSCEESVRNMESVEIMIKKSQVHDVEAVYVNGKGEKVHEVRMKNESQDDFQDDAPMSERGVPDGDVGVGAGVDVSVHENEFMDDDEKLASRRTFLEEDSRQYPTEKLMYLFILWVGLALITFLKGGKGVQSLLNITCASPWYPILIACQFLWTIGFAIIFGLRLVKNHRAKVECNYPFLENDVLWDVPKLRFYASFTFIAGVVAGLIGIGGGMVLGPLMLVMGVHPRVSSATTATMIVLTSSSVAIMFVTSGLVPWEYALFFFCVCFCGAFVGKKYIDTYIKRTGMSSILIGILATIIGVATIGCVIIVLLNLSKADWCLDGFKKFCDVNALSDELTECSIDKSRQMLFLTNT